MVVAVWEVLAMCGTGSVGGKVLAVHGTGSVNWYRQCGWMVLIVRYCGLGPRNSLLLLRVLLSVFPFVKAFITVGVASIGC